MSVSVGLSPIPVLQFFDNTGRPAVGGSLTTQVGGLNYPAYSDNLGNTPLPNPISLNSRGEISTAAGATSELFLQQGVAYTLILKDAAGNQLWSVSNVVAALSGQSVSLPAVSGTANAIILTNAQPVTVAKGTIVWFIPTAANTAATTINVDNNGAVSTLYLTKALVGGEIQPNVPMQIISDGTVWNLAWSAKGPATDTYPGTGGGSGVYGVTVNAAQAAYSNGFSFKYISPATNITSTPTINVNGLGAVNLYYMDGATQIAAGTLIQNVIYRLTYSGALNSSAGGFYVENPSRVTGSTTATIATGLTTTPTFTLNYAILPDGKTIYTWITTGASGTSNATTKTITGIPSAIVTTTSKRIYCFIEDATTTAGGLPSIVTGTSTTWTPAANTAGTGGWTASGTWAILPCQMTFSND